MAVSAVDALSPARGMSTTESRTIEVAGPADCRHSPAEPMPEETRPKLAFSPQELCGPPDDDD